MIPVMHKLVAVTPPAAIVDNAALICNVIDTLGFRFLRVVLHLGASDIAVVSAKLQESDVQASSTSLTGGADIVGTRLGTDLDDTGATGAVPSATDDNKFLTWEIDLRGRKRYILPVVTGGDGSAGAYLMLWGELYRGENTPTTAAQKGLLRNMRVPVL